MNTKTTLKIVTLCVICAVTLMSGCLEVDEPAPTTESVPEIGTYNNPTPLGEVLTSSTGALDIAIIFIQRGEDVNYMAQRENSFNDIPKNGNEYMLVGMIVGYCEMDHLDNDEKFLLSSRDFSAYANNVECDSPFLVLPEEFDTSSSTYMMPGSISNVLMLFEVPKGKRVTISYDRLFVSDAYYFDAGTGNFDDVGQSTIDHDTNPVDEEKSTETYNNKGVFAAPSRGSDPIDNLLSDIIDNDVANKGHYSHDGEAKDVHVCGNMACEQAEWIESNYGYDVGVTLLWSKFGQVGHAQTWVIIDDERYILESTHHEYWDVYEHKDEFGDEYKICFNTIKKGREHTKSSSEYTRTGK